MDIVERQLVVIHKDLNGVSQFSIPLDLGFTPDYVIVREVILSDNGHGGGNGTHVITAPWVRSKENILLAFDDTSNYLSNPNTHFLIKHSGMIMNGDSTFTVREATDTLSASTATGRIAITLEFGLYERRRSIDEIIITSTRRMVETMVERGCVYPFCVPNQDGGGAIPSGEIDPSIEPMPQVHPTQENLEAPPNEETFN